jgi:phosphoglycolate phosphatase
VKPGTLAKHVRGRLFFDLDGTLTDPREGIVACLRHALEGIDVQPPPDDDLARLIGPPLQQSLQGLLGRERGHLVAKALELYRVRFSAVGMFENRVYAGIPGALGALRDAGWRLSVVTSKPHTFAVPILEHFALAASFATVYGSELSGERTDKAELIGYALRAEGAPAEQVIMIGDRSHDIVGARANSVQSRGVLWGYGTREELVDAGADGLFETPASLISELTPATDSVSAG